MVYLIQLEDDIWGGVTLGYTTTLEEAREFMEARQLSQYYLTDCPAGDKIEIWCDKEGNVAYSINEINKLM